MKNRLFVLLFLLSTNINSYAHPMPNTLVMLDVKEKIVSAELQIPLTELELAFGKNLSLHPNNIITVYGDSLITYILIHFRPRSVDAKNWTVVVNTLNVDSTQQLLTGRYYELKAFLTLTPPENASTRNFILDYDLVIHQLVTHKAIIYIRQDWENGVTRDNANEIGVISLDIKNNTIQPFIVDLQKGSRFKGFKNIFWLGVTHIAEGTDHLLFLLVLLLPASLIVIDKRWSIGGGRKYTFIRLVKIATAFTIGHSLTLILGALNIVQLPAKPVEVFIAVSILITAIHCLRPLFYGKEIYIAAGFGLVHGLAFATILSNLHLEGIQMALSILAFNLGIEAMQLLIIFIVFPILLWLCNKSYYKYIKNTGAFAAIILSVTWIAERLG
jgi:hypothetical protein